MEQVLSSGDVKEQKMKNGTSTKSLYIKHMSLEDWEILKRIKATLQDASIADAVRFAIRKAGGVI